MVFALFRGGTLERCQENKAALESDKQQWGETSSPEHSVPCQYTVIGSHDGLVFFVEDLRVLQEPISVLYEFRRSQRSHECSVLGGWG